MLLYGCLADVKIYMLLIFSVVVFYLLKFKQFCVHDYEGNIFDRNLARQCRKSELKLFHNGVESEAFGGGGETKSAL